MRGHLVRRFFGSLSPAGPSAADEEWARRSLLPGEEALWRRMAGPDRRHAAGVGRRVIARLGDQATPPVVAAALLHDVGKVEARLGTFGRVAATLIGWGGKRRAGGRIGVYLDHPEIGARLLEEAGSDALTVAWAREHHRPADRWSLPRDIATALKASDDD